jgi:cysteine desulfurase
MNRIHVVGTTIEHSSVLETLRDLERQGVSVSYVGVNEQGIVNVDDVMAVLRPETVLVTCMYANNEIGTIQPVSKIGSAIRKIRSAKVGLTLVESDVSTDPLFPAFHSDASQAPLWLSCDLEGLRVDALTLDAHKMQGPKGVGLLVLKRGVPCDPLMIGGGQERGMRPTTESVELATGLAEALTIAHEGREERCASALRARDAFVTAFTRDFPEGLINGSLERRLPNNINISIPDLGDAEFAVIKLDQEGIACSTKSSCLKGEETSYVVSALGGPAWRAHNTLRFSFDPYTSVSDVEKIVSALRLLA